MLIFPFAVCLKFYLSVRVCRTPFMSFPICTVIDSAFSTVNFLYPAPRLDLPIGLLSAIPHTTLRRAIPSHRGGRIIVSITRHCMFLSAVVYVSPFPLYTLLRRLSIPYIPARTGIFLLRR